MEKHAKVVIIGGGVVGCSILYHLSKFGLNKEIYMKKLEIYSFANCASRMNYVYDKYPYMEHFANGEDFVARLGCNCCENAPPDKKSSFKPDKFGL